MSKEPTIGTLADNLHAISEKIKSANAVVTELEGQKHELETQIISALEANGIDSVRGNYATLSITKSIKPQIADYEALCAFVIRKKALHLFERRISSKAYAELKADLKGKDVPGLSEFTQVKLSVRKVTKE